MNHCERQIAINELIKALNHMYKTFDEVILDYTSTKDVKVTNHILNEISIFTKKIIEYKEYVTNN